MNPSRISVVHEERQVLAILSVTIFIYRFLLEFLDRQVLCSNFSFAISLVDALRIRDLLICDNP